MRDQVYEQRMKTYEDTDLSKKIRRGEDRTTGYERNRSKADPPIGTSRDLDHGMSDDQFKKFVDNNA